MSEGQCDCLDAHSITAKLMRKQRIIHGAESFELDEHCMGALKQLINARKAVGLELRKIPHQSDGGNELIGTLKKINEDICELLLCSSIDK